MAAGRPHGGQPHPPPAPGNAVCHPDTASLKPHRPLHQEQPETQSALQLLLVKALSCLSGIELSALNVNVSELLDQTVSYFMGSGSSRFNSQVHLVLS